jgi:hypothetical protein
VGKFSNGEMGREFVDRFCCRCRNWKDDEERGPGCPVWDAHLLADSQYPEHAKNDFERGRATATQFLLGVLIEWKPDQLDNECQMFDDSDAPDPRQGELAL